jgi:hypothetical protein
MTRVDVEGKECPVGGLFAVERGEGNLEITVEREQTVECEESVTGTFQMQVEGRARVRSVSRRRLTLEVRIQS